MYNFEDVTDAGYALTVAESVHKEKSTCKRAHQMMWNC